MNTEIPANSQSIPPSSASAPELKNTPQNMQTLDKMRYNAMDVFRTADASAKARLQQATVDGFDNFLSNVGLNNDNTISASTYEFNLLTRNRIILEAAYRGSWVVGSIVDAWADDMTRAGIDITTSDDQNIKKIKKAMVKRKIWGSMNFLAKMGRLYGGALGVHQVDGQDMSTPLDIKTIGKGQYKGIVVYDRWQLNPVLTPVIESGPDMGLPKYYQIVTGWTSNDPKNMTPAGQITVHHSRCIRYTGIDLPYFQAITEMMWGESILERLWDRLISFDNTTMSTASLVDRANLRTVAIEGLREILALGGDARKGLDAMFDMMRRLQVNEGLTLIDKNDTFSTTAYSFAGLSDVLLQFAQQLAGASGIPLVRLFGQSPAGLGATGDADIRMYYDSILSCQEAKFREAFEITLRIMWRSTFGEAAPSDLEFEFTPLWQMTETDKATNAKTTAETIIGAYESGLVKASTAMTELRNSSGNTGIFGNISDADIAEADLQADEPPMPGETEESVSPETPVGVPVQPLDRQGWFSRLLRRIPPKVAPVMTAAASFLFAVLPR